MYGTQPKKRIPRLKVWDTLTTTYGVNCVYCHGQPATQVEHVIPISYGGNNRLVNLRPVCSWCNLLVGDRVFESFDEKYEWLRQERQRKQRLQKRTVCIHCLLPYQTPLHSPSPFLCAECYDLEYDTKWARRRQWREWLYLCERALLIPSLHKRLAQLHPSGGSRQKLSRSLGSLYLEHVGCDDAAEASELWLTVA